MPLSFTRFPSTDFAPFRLRHVNLRMDTLPPVLHRVFKQMPEQLIERLLFVFKGMAGA